MALKPLVLPALPMPALSLPPIPLPPCVPSPMSPCMFPKFSSSRDLNCLHPSLMAPQCSESVVSGTWGRLPQPFMGEQGGAG